METFMSPDYTTSYSDVTGLSDVLDTGGNSTPLRVDSADVPKTDIPGFRDYIPSATRRALAKVQKSDHEADKQAYSRRNHVPEVGILLGAPDYVSGADSEGIRKQRQKAIIREAKKIRIERKTAWVEYKKAEELMQDMKKDPDLGSRVSNDPEVRRANAIVNAGKPASTDKDSCIEAARNRVLGLQD